MPQRHTEDEWNQFARAVGVEWIGSRPRNQSDRQPCRCLDCGMTWDAYPKTIRYSAKGCPACAAERRSAGRRHSPGIWDRRASDVGIEWIGEDPIQSSIPHLARCRTCTHEWHAYPRNVQQGRGCPACPNRSKGRPRVSTEEHLHRFREVGAEWVGDPPTLTHIPVLTRCCKCGHIWLARPSNIQQGHGCPRCSSTRPSKEG